LRRHPASVTLASVATLRVFRGLLSNRPLVRLLGGEFVSSVGDWLYLVALLIVVYQGSGADAVLLGVVGAARVLPYVLLSIPAGIVADRFDRRLVLLVTDVARGLIMVVMAWLVAVDGPLWAVVVLAVVATCFSAFFGPAIGSYLPMLVRDERELGPANSAWSTLDNLAFVVGPAIGGLLIAASGLSLAFLLNAVSFGCVAVVLWRLPSRPQTAEPRAGQAEAADTPAEGREPRATDGLRPVALPLAGLTLVDVVAGFVFGGLGVLTVMIAVDQLGVGEAGTGYLNAAIGVGGIVGAIGSGAFVVRPGLRVPLLLGAVGMAVGAVVLGMTTSLAPALVAMAVFEAGALLTEVVGMTILQRVIPDAVRGRALGMIATVSTLANAAGSLVVPIGAAIFGIGAVLVACGIVAVVGIALAALLIGSAGDRGPAPEFVTVAARAAALPVFGGVPESSLIGAFARATELRVPGGTVVIRQGDPADRFYVILEGTFVVDQSAAPGVPPARLRTMGADEVFGEIGLLAGVPRTATVTAEGDGRLLALEARDFLELVTAGAELGPRLLALHRGGVVGAG
jgi:MFS family permease